MRYQDIDSRRSFVVLGRGLFAHMRKSPLAVTALNWVARPFYRRRDYDTLRWNPVVDWIWRSAPAFIVNWMANRLFKHSPHYVYPENGLFFRRGELVEKVGMLEKSRREIAQRTFLPFVKQQDILVEFGCGPGFLLKALAPFCRQAIGVDVSQAALRLAERALAAVPNVKFVRCSGIDLNEIESGSVSIVVSYQTMQHIDHVHAIGFFCEFLRVLKPGGRVVFHYPDLTRADELEACFQEWQRQRGLPLSRLSPQRIRYYTPDFLTAILQRAGFRKVSFFDGAATPVSAAAHLCLAEK